MANIQWNLLYIEQDSIIQYAALQFAKYRCRVNPGVFDLSYLTLRRRHRRIPDCSEFQEVCLQ